MATSSFRFFRTTLTGTAIVAALCGAAGSTPPDLRAARRPPDTAGSRKAGEPRAQATPVPPPWGSADVGGPIRGGNATWVSGTFRLNGVGTEIGGKTDQFGFVYQKLDGDGEIVARVERLERAEIGAMAGVMFRDELRADAKYAAALLTGDKGLAFQHRTTDGETTKRSVTGRAHRWLKLARKGQTFSAFSSSDGSRWEPLGSNTVPLNRSAYVGLVVTSRSSETPAGASFDSVSVTSARPEPTTLPPAVALTAPTPGHTCPTPCSIIVSAAATDPDGIVASVDFYAGQALIGSATRSPFTITWIEVPAGTHALTAVAHDNAGGATTSAGVVVSAIESRNQPPTVSISTPVSGAAYTAPAAVEIVAMANDQDGSIARVEFYAGSTLIGSAGTSPYTVTWRDAPAGTYTLSAKAWDGAGAAMISAGVNVTVTAGPTLLAGWQTLDVGTPLVTGSARHDSATFTVVGAGADISENADQFRFVYQPLDGDGEVAACVASLDYVHSWTKAGVMVRETLAADSRHAFGLLSAGWGVAFHHRSETGGATAQAGVAPGVAPHCVRLVRKGNLFSAFQSADGRKWLPMGSRTIPMSTAVHVGLAVTSHDASRPARAIFNQILVSDR